MKAPLLSCPDAGRDTLTPFNAGIMLAFAAFLR
jgi:hypothetical protein